MIFIAHVRNLHYQEQPQKIFKKIVTLCYFKRITFNKCQFDQKGIKIDFMELFCVGSFLRLAISQVKLLIFGSFLESKF